MPIEPEKKIVSEDVKRSKRKVNLHNLAGGHSIDQIRSAIKVEIKNVVQEDDSLFVTVHVTNVNSGHKIPTGTPSRQLILRVSVRDRSGRFYLESDKVFEKVLMDENKQILRTDHEIMLKASRVYYDNRIGPKEVREVPFSFSIPYPNLIKDWKRKLTVEAKTLYQFLPQVIGPQPMIVEVAGDIYPRK